MDDDSRLEKLINQCKSNDVDAKIDAVTKLQLEFENGIEINDPDGLINAFKACLRTSNQHLTAATISAIPPLLPLLISPTVTPSKNQPFASMSSSTSSQSPSPMIDAVTLRQVLTAFLPTGGVIDRLGDSREKARDKARETLVILGGFAYRSSSSAASSKSKEGKGPETPLMIFERFIREGGLGSKVWKTRAQAILTLVDLRRAHILFPIRGYLPQLVAALEDGDAHVRDCARPAVIELFTGPGVTDAARADLKKEMVKKGVRKTIVDGVLSKLVSGSGANGTRAIDAQSEGSENGDAVNGSKQKGYVPPSLALQSQKSTATAAGPSGISRTTSTNISRPASRAAMTEPPTPATEGADIQPVYITSSRDMEAEFSAMSKLFEGKETEHNWMTRENSILRVRGMLKGDAHLRYPDVFLSCLKDSFIQWSLKTLASLRTTVAVNTTSLYAELAFALGPALDPFCDTLLTHLLKMAGFTKKIASQQSQLAVTAILTHTSAQPRTCLPLLWNTLQEKTVQARAFVVGHIKKYLEVHGNRSKNTIESSGGLQTLEKSLKKALADPNPAVRESSRVCFWVFEEIWHDRGIVILESLDSVARKQLEKACPNPDAVATLPTAVTAKTGRKSSVAAAIAASRAKAKAIATAPPTLRHQATSSSQIARAISPPVKSDPLPSPTSPRGATPATSPVSRQSNSPPSARSRILPNQRSRASVTSRSPPSSTRAESPTPLATTPYRRVALQRPTSMIATTTTTRMTSTPTSSPPRHSSSVPRNSIERVVAVPIPARQKPAVTSPHLGSEAPPRDDSDSEESANLMSFSAAFETETHRRQVGAAAGAPQRKSDSPVLSLSPRSDPAAGEGVSNALSSGSGSGFLPGGGGPAPPVVEDALRARAEQAESAAERLLELVEPEEEGVHHSSIPTSLLVGSAGTSASAGPGPGVGVKEKPVPVPLPLPATTMTTPPATPVSNRNAAIMRQAAMFKDSPAYKGSSSSSSLLDVLRDRKHESGWWMKRMKVVDQAPVLSSSDGSSVEDELQGAISALEQNKADTRLLQRLSRLCIENPSTVTEPASPVSSSFDSFGQTPASPSPFIVDDSQHTPQLAHSELWTKGKKFERLFNALMIFLDPAKSEAELEYGLIVLWEMLENQAAYVEGREGDIFSMLLTVRYCNKQNVLEATNTIRDGLISRIEPVYGLTTMHASLRAFNNNTNKVANANAEVKASTYAFGLSGLGKFIMRLPAEILEDELPRMKSMVIGALNDTSLVVRESAAASIIAAQLVMRDETHLFMLLDGLADEKKNLLTYLFDKHGVRGVGGFLDRGGIEKLKKEMRRLDTRTSTPPRGN